MGAVEFTRLAFDADAKTVIFRARDKFTGAIVQIELDKFLDGNFFAELASDEPSSVCIL